MSDFRASAGILSGPTAYPLLICVMFVLIPSIVGGMTSIGRSVCSVLMSGGFSEAGIFKISSKCSTHLFLCSSISVIGFPSLSFTGLSGLVNLPASFFVVSYICLIYPSVAGFSAVVARPSTYFCLLALILYLTWLYASVYSVCALTFSVLVRLLLIVYSCSSFLEPCPGFL